MYMKGSNDYWQNQFGDWKKRQKSTLNVEIVDEEASWNDQYKRWVKESQRGTIDNESEKRFINDVAKNTDEYKEYSSYLSRSADYANAAVDYYNKRYGSGQWQSEWQNSNFSSVINNYVERNNKAREYYTANRDILGDEYNDAIQHLDSLDAIYSQLLAGAGEASKVYGQYSSADEYNAAVRESGYFDKYYGLDSTAIQGYIADLTRSGENTAVRKLTDEESGQISADLNRDYANADSRYKDAFAMWQAGDYDMATVAQLKRERDLAKARVDQFNANPTYYSMPAENKNQAEIDWLSNYATVADYYAGVKKYGTDLAQLEPYELTDYIDGISDAEQRQWAETYMTDASASAGHISTEEYRRVAEGQRVFDGLGSGIIYDSLYSAAEKYLDVRSYAYDRAAYIEGNQYATSQAVLKDMGEYDVLVHDIAAATGMSYEEVQQKVKSVLPYVAYQRSQKERAQIRKMAQETPYAATALTWLASPVANATADLSVLSSKLFGTELVSYDPNLYGYYFVTDTRDQVSSDLSETYTEQTFWGANRAEWIYNVVNDFFDSASASLYTGGLSNLGGSAVLDGARRVVSSAFESSGVLSDKYIELRQKGYDGTQALGASVLTVLGAGFADYFADTIPMDKLIKSENTFAKMMQWYSENAAPSIGSNWTKAAVDYFWLKEEDGSQRFKALKGLFLGYRRAGFSDREAFYKAWEDFIMNEDFSSFVSGALSYAAG